MSLNWQHSDHTRADWDGLSDARREALIFRTMTVGMNRITEANVEDFYIRNNITTAAVGGVALSLDECRAAIGLSTNAEKLTDAKFREAIYSTLKYRATQDFHRASDARRAAEAETN